MKIYDVVCPRCNKSSGVELTTGGILCTCQRRSDALTHLLSDITRHVRFGDFEKIMPAVGEYRRLVHHLTAISEPGHNGVRGTGSEVLRRRISND
jgi:hypothetical protein